MSYNARIQMQLKFGQTKIEKLHQWMNQSTFLGKMTEIICSSLLLWQSSSSYSVHNNQSKTIQEATTHQDRIGWKCFMDGFFTTKWRTGLRAHYLFIKSQKSEILWMAKLQRKLWEIAYKMWDHRNNDLHREGLTIHKHELQALNNEIMTEFTIGIDLLPRRRYSNLFQGTVRERLQDNHHLKRMWLTNMWTARDKFGSNFLRQRSVIAAQFFKRWYGRVHIERSDNGR